MTERYWQEVKKCPKCNGTGVYNDYTDYGDQPCPDFKCDSGWVRVGKPMKDASVWALLDAVPPPEMPDRHVYKQAKTHGGCEECGYPEHEWLKHYPPLDHTFEGDRPCWCGALDHDSSGHANR